MLDKFARLACKTPPGLQIKDISRLRWRLRRRFPILAGLLFSEFLKLLGLVSLPGSRSTLERVQYAGGMTWPTKRKSVHTLRAIAPRRRGVITAAHFAKAPARRPIFNAGVATRTARRPRPGSND